MFNFLIKELNKIILNLKKLTLFNRIWIIYILYFKKFEKLKWREKIALKKFNYSILIRLSILYFSDTLSWKVALQMFFYNFESSVA